MMYADSLEQGLQVCRLLLGGGISMKKRLVLCFDGKRFGNKTFYLCESEEAAKALAEECKEGYNRVELVAVPDDLQMYYK